MVHDRSASRPGWLALLLSINEQVATRFEGCDEKVLLADIRDTRGQVIGEPRRDILALPEMGPSTSARYYQASTSGTRYESHTIQIFYDPDIKGMPAMQLLNKPHTDSFVLLRSKNLLYS